MAPFRLRLGSCLLVVLCALSVSGAAQAPSWPSVISLPNGFQAEGIAGGRGTEFFVGSLANGAIYQGDVRTGQGSILVAGQSGRMAAGLSLDPRSGYLYVAGVLTGAAYIYDSRTGQTVATLTLTTSPSLINDVVVTRTAAYFTDSFSPQLYVLPLGAGGTPSGPVQMLPLTGDWTQIPNDFNANGIQATADGRWLIVVNSATGILYRVDSATGHATAIPVTGGSLTSGDGLLLEGRTLYVVRNFLNQIAVVRLDPGLTAGQVTGTITDPAFGVPTTVAAFGNALYAVNGHFDVAPPFTPPNPSQPYEVVRVPQRP